MPRLSNIIPSIPADAEQPIRLDAGSGGSDEQLDLNTIIEQVASDFEIPSIDQLVADALVKVNAQSAPSA